MSESRREIYESYGINWMWYLEVERIDGDEVRFVREWRVHKFDYDKDTDPHPLRMHVLGEYEFRNRERDGVWLSNGKMNRDKSWTFCLVSN